MSLTNFSSSFLRFRLFSTLSPPPPPPPRHNAHTSWLHKPAPQPPPSAATGPTTTTSIDRIVHRLRNLDLDNINTDSNTSNDTPAPLDGNERLGDLLDRNWTRPDKHQLVLNANNTNTTTLLPWERGGNVAEFEGKEEEEGTKKRRLKAPTLAELTIEDAELRRLRQLGMTLRERVSVAKAGVTAAIAEKIHDAWRKSELVRLKFHEDLAHDMKTAHELVERRTGGLVTWRSGSVMIVYRGSNYKRPVKGQPPESNSASAEDDDGTPFIPNVSSPAKSSEKDKQATSSVTEQSRMLRLDHQDTDNMTEDELEFNRLLDDLGPRFFDWWGTGILPVDADLLPETIPGYRTPFRCLPTGMRLSLTNAEMTNLRKLARKLPCHFALGRNRHHQGLAAAILKLWEKSLVVKIAVKRGIQNTNNKLMSEELKMLTGGTLLLRNKYYIVMYRGKDFLPPSVATALAERQELTEDIHNVEEKTRNISIGESFEDELDGHALVGTLAEFQQAQARWGREVTAQEKERMKEEAARSEKTRLFKRLEHKLYIAQGKKMKAEKLLSKIEASMVLVNPSDDQEIITDEERSVFRRIGLRMKSYLPLGIRGVFDGVIENMHLHWKHRELVKLISKQKTLSFVEETARLLEYESGGILVAIERIPKGYAIVYYRGKNYRRPLNLRPRNLLTKAKALKRAVAMQRHEALSEHIALLETNIREMKLELGIEEDDEEEGISENEESEGMLEEEEAEGIEEEDDDGGDDEYTISASSRYNEVQDEEDIDGSSDEDDDIAGLDYGDEPSSRF